ncbi:MAG: ATP-binding protein [Firmicutes bacterium]|nr:ATP-binding protein [Bacillota bacterium]
MNLYRREAYLQKIRGFYHDTGLIKVITGVRRCGKSCLMETIRQELMESGIPNSQIIYLNLDKRGYRNIRTADQLDELIAAFPRGNELSYLFIDEIQNVKDFEPLINAYREEGRFSVFVTGSNSYLLSGELVTKLTGRYVEIEMFPLTFREWLGMKAFRGQPAKGVHEEFREYVRRGGFPKLLEFENDADKDAYAANVVGQIVDKDIHRRVKIRNRSAFPRIMDFVVNNFGATASLTSIADFFAKRESLKISPETVNGYIETLENAKILYRCPRFDVKSRKSMSREQKYYLADLGIYFARNADGRVNYGPALENILFVYLKSKGYAVSVGRIGKLECDFIARKGDQYHYIQVATTIADPATEEREYAPFRHVRDNYPKHIFTMDPLPQNRDGVLHHNIAEFIAAGLNL